jgi:hypothetical protein
MDGNRRCIGLDVHREFAQVAIWQAATVTQAGVFATTTEGVRGPGSFQALRVRWVDMDGCAVRVGGRIEEL